MDSNLTGGTTRPHLFPSAADAHQAVTSHRSYMARPLSAPLSCGLLERMDGEGLPQADPGVPDV